MRNRKRTGALAGLAVLLAAVAAAYTLLRSLTGLAQALDDPFGFDMSDTDGEDGDLF